MTDRFIPDEDDEGREDEAAAGSEGTSFIPDGNDGADPFDIPVGDAPAVAESVDESVDEEDPVTPEPETPPAGTPVEVGDGWGFVDIRKVVGEDPWSAPVETHDPAAPEVAAEPIDDPAREIVVDPLIDWPEDIPEPSAVFEEAMPPFSFTIPEKVTEEFEVYVPPSEVESSVAGDPFEEDSGGFEDASAEDADVSEVVVEPFFAAESTVAADPFAEVLTEEALEALEDYPVAEDFESVLDEDAPRFVVESAFAADPLGEALTEEVGEAVDDALVSDESDALEDVVEPFLVVESALTADPFGEALTEEALEAPVAEDSEPVLDEDAPRFGLESAFAADPFGEVLQEGDLEVAADTSVADELDVVEVVVEPFFAAESTVAADPIAEVLTEEALEALEDYPVAEDFESVLDEDAPRFVLEPTVAADPFADALSEEGSGAGEDDPVSEDAGSPEGIEWVFLEKGEEGGHWGFVADVVPEGDTSVDPEAAADSDTADVTDAHDADEGSGSPVVVSAIEEEFRLDELRGREDKAEEPEEAGDETGDEGSVPEAMVSEQIVVVESGDRKAGKRYLADAAWLGGEALARKVLFEVVDGRFVVVKPSSKDKEAKRLRGIVLPGLVNTHSHTFHRLLRGRTHRQGGDFWSWRDRMFDVAIALDPVVYEDVAAAVFVEMAMAGITTVGEFHYLHHRIGGVPYRDPNEMGHAMIRAARRAGIRIGLLDAGYLAAGFGRPALHPVQERFSDRTGEAWLERAGLMCEQYAKEEDVRIGLAPHSVRAVPDDALRRLAEWRNPETKLHIHVSEQPAENLSCMAAHGLSPVGLLESVGLLGPNTTAIHATHLTDADIGILGSTHTGVCLCPTTERDLADGIGPSRALRTAGSTLTVGSDSHSEIDLFEEARGIEHHHRLAAGRRGGFAPATLLEATTVNGAAALGSKPTASRLGRQPTSSCSTGTHHGSQAYRPAESVVFAASASDVLDVYVGGRKIVSKGMHPQWKKARKTFKARR